MSPDLIGINAGAALAAVLLITVIGTGTGWLPAGALIGSLLTAITICWRTSKVWSGIGWCWSGSG